MMSTNDTSVGAGENGRDATPAAARTTAQPKPSPRHILTNTSSSGSGL